jgi:2-dehydropantoate 2-reductase
MRYIIIGAGAIGGTIGARLFQSGHEVVLAARGAHHAAMRDGGLRFATPAGLVTLPIPAVAGPGELTLRGDDVLITAVKTQDAVALRRFRHVYGVCVWLPATHLEPGLVEAQGAPMTGLLPVGRYPTGADETAGQVAADLAGSTFLAPVSPDVMRWKYGKLLGNLGNAVEAVCGPAPAVGEGAEAVLAAAGIDYARTAELTTLRGDQVKIEPVDGAGRSGGSSWQSLTRGTGSIEADYLNGEVVLLGRQHRVPAPVNELLQRLANQFAADRRPPGSITAGELAALMAA